MDSELGNEMEELRAMVAALQLRVGNLESRLGTAEAGPPFGTSTVEPLLVDNLPELFPDLGDLREVTVEAPRDPMEEDPMEEDPIEELLREAQGVASGTLTLEGLEARSGQTAGSEEEQQTDGQQTAPLEGSKEEDAAPEPRGRLHTILGDSIGVGLRIPVRPGDELINLAESGNTWTKEELRVGGHIAKWAEESRGRNLEQGRVFIWMGGNDIYGRPWQKAQGIEERAVEGVLRKLNLRDADVVVAGPTPRMWADSGRDWEDTAAFRADRILRGTVEAAGAKFIPYLGRALTSMRRRRHALLPDVAHQFFTDGIHLSEEGYRRVERRLKNVFL